jgi:MinD-like ATPase involved in chromosome partitioning or flagellar assembly
VTSIVVAHASGSPGATTCAVLGAAECGRPAMVVEAALTGGTLPGAGLRWTPGVVTLASSFPGPLNRAVLEEHAQMSALGVPVVVGAPGGPEAAACMARLVAPLSAWTSSGGGEADVLVMDCGLLSTGSVLRPLASSADLTVLVVRQTPQAAGECAARIRHTHALAVALAADGARVAALVVGQSPYSAAEIASAVGVAVIAVVPWEASVAAIAEKGWSATGRRGDHFRRAVQSMGLAMVASAEAPTEVDHVVGVA